MTGPGAPLAAYVLDTSAVLALLLQETGQEIVRGIIQDPAGTCYMHVLNICEVYYRLQIIGEKARAAGQPITAPPAGGAIQSLYLMAVQLRRDMDRSFWEDAADLKVRHQHASLADCFCAALARRLGAELVTADRHFQTMELQGECVVRFIR